MQANTYEHMAPIECYVLMFYCYSSFEPNGNCLLVVGGAKEIAN